MRPHPSTAASTLRIARRPSRRQWDRFMRGLRISIFIAAVGVNEGAPEAPVESTVRYVTHSTVMAIVSKVPAGAC
ncbi:MAG: hypothetical protein U1A77_21840 [Pirellulales bacterium]